LHEYRTFSNLAFYFLRKARKPYVISLHGELEYHEKQTWDVLFLRRLFNKAFGKNFLENANAILALTDYERSQLIQLGIQEDKIVVIPNAINPEDFCSSPPNGYFRSLFKLKNEDIVLFVGRLHIAKGLDTLVKAFSLLKGRENLKLVLAGPDDGMLESLQRLVASLQLKEKVLFTGYLNRKQVLAALNDATVVVYPSMREGFGLVVIEAGMAGKPVIVSNHPSMSYVKKGHSGLTVEYGNIMQLKAAMEKLLDNTLLSLKLGQNGRKYVLGNFTWDIISAQIEDVYSRIVS
jgi:glycosyltransferase involved in cell wall biosynthesis